METGNVVHILDEGVYLIRNADQGQTIFNPDEGRFHQDVPQGQGGDLK